jgi:hypothetical protein
LLVSVARPFIAHSHTLLPIHFFSSALNPHTAIRTGHFNATTMAAPQLREIEHPGLEWQEDLFSCQPHCTREPSIGIVKDLVVRHLDLGDEAPAISFFAEDAFNKLYAIECSKGHFIFRTSLPVAPGVKTQSEVATATFVRKNTSIPVPILFAYNANLQNELGFE